MISCNQNVDYYNNCPTLDLIDIDWGVKIKRHESGLVPYSCPSIYKITCLTLVDHFTKETYLILVI